MRISEPTKPYTTQAAKPRQALHGFPTGGSRSTGFETTPSPPKVTTPAPRSPRTPLRSSEQSANSCPNRDTPSPPKVTKPLTPRTPLTPGPPTPGSPASPVLACWGGTHRSTSVGWKSTSPASIRRTKGEHIYCTFSPYLHQSIWLRRFIFSRFPGRRGGPRRPKLSAGGGIALAGTGESRHRRGCPSG